MTTMSPIYRSPPWIRISNDHPLPVDFLPRPPPPLGSPMAMGHVLAATVLTKDTMAQAAEAVHNAMSPAGTAATGGSLLRRGSRFREDEDFVLA
mmetsp:Transcript_12257/g.29965  ORF Transcript_12257/g.29965 Transcript_12257/m.29965 type:complete len:94 (-) Transcript_12257:266-547(-)